MGATADNHEVVGLQAVIAWQPAPPPPGPPSDCPLAISPLFLAVDVLLRGSLDF